MALTVKNASRREMQIFIDWAREEGWNPGINDLDSFYSTDPTGFFLCFNDDEPVGSISAVKYSKDFGFIGFYIVKQEFRNYGNIAYMLGRHASEYLNGCNIGLDGVLERVENYKKLGFKYSHKNFRFEGFFDKKEEYSIDKNISSFYVKDFKYFLDYDRFCFPSKRTTFLKNWLNKGTNTQYIYKSGSGAIEGIGMIRQCFNGNKIGSLFADNFDIAEKLFLSLIIGRKGPVYLDIPETNENALMLVEKYNMKQCFATARMYSESIPKLKNKRIYGITTFELG